MTVAPPGQQQFAQQLGIDLSAITETADLVKDIEQRLGKNKDRELARWFMLSAWRFQQRGTWQEAEQSGLSPEQQYHLADELLNDKEAMSSLRTVLRDPRFRFSLVNFDRLRDPGSLTLASTTVAFRHAQQLLNQASIEVGQKEQPIPVSEDGAEALVVDRRARRRGYTGPELDIAPLANIVDPIRVSRPRQERGSALNDAEYQALDDALQNAPSAENRNFSYRSHEDKISLLLGIGSGLVLFLLVSWVFL